MGGQYQEESEEEPEEEDDRLPPMGNINFNTLNPTLFLENPSLIVQKNLIQRGWFLMNDNRIMGNFNSLDMLSYLDDKIKDNKVENLAITDYETDIYFTPNNLYEILKETLPKIMGKVMKKKTSTGNVNVPPHFPPMNRNQMGNIKGGNMGMPVQQRGNNNQNQGMDFPQQKYIPVGMPIKPQKTNTMQNMNYARMPPPNFPPQNYNINVQIVKNDINLNNYSFKEPNTYQGYPMNDKMNNPQGFQQNNIKQTGNGKGTGTGNVNQSSQVKSNNMYPENTNTSTGKRK